MATPTVPFLWDGGFTDTTPGSEASEAILYTWNSGVLTAILRIGNGNIEIQTAPGIWQTLVPSDALPTPGSGVPIVTD